jgi:hypothetical protein
MIAAISILIFPILAGWFCDKGQPDPNTAEGKAYYR